MNALDHSTSARKKGTFLVHKECGSSRNDIYEERWAEDGDS
jgi:hypothetical protein